jgi:hypothetical protein
MLPPAILWIVPLFLAVGASSLLRAISRVLLEGRFIVAGGLRSWR